MLSKTALILTIPLALAVGTVAVTDIAIVDVRADGKHFVVPVPLALSKLAVQFIPEDEKIVELDCDRYCRYTQDLAEAIEALRNAENGQLVEVIDRDTHITVKKEGGTLIARVQTGTDTVYAELPLKTVGRVLEQIHGDRVEIADLVNAVQGNLGFGKIVDVNTDDGETQVKVWVF